MSTQHDPLDTTRFINGSKWSYRVNLFFTWVVLGLKGLTLLVKRVIGLKGLTLLVKRVMSVLTLNGLASETG
jgi:hypothetical protein